MIKMLKGTVHVLKPYDNLDFHVLDNLLNINEFKSLKTSLAVMVIHCCILLEQKSKLRWTIKVWVEVFCNIYISMFMQSLTVEFHIY